jgi:hypothetical protein
MDHPKPPFGKRRGKDKGSHKGFSSLIRTILPLSPTRWLLTKVEKATSGSARSSSRRIRTGRTTYEAALSCPSKEPLATQQHRGIRLVPLNEHGPSAQRPHMLPVLQPTLHGMAESQWTIQNHRLGNEEGKTKGHIKDSVR